MNNQPLLLWLQAFRIITVFLAIGSMIGVMRWFRQSSQRNLALLWFGYWAALAAQYIPSAVATFLNARKAYPFFLWVVLADVAQSLFLILVAAALPPTRSATAIRRALLLIAPLAVAVVVCAAVDPQWLWTDRLQTLLGFAAFTWFSARWVVRAAPRPIAFVAFFAFLPAAHYVFLLGTRVDEPSLWQVVGILINLPAYVALAYFCRASLYISGGVDEITQSAPAAGAGVESASQSPTPVEVPVVITTTRHYNYNDVYAFIRDPGEKPGGKLVVAGIAAVLFALAIAVIAILPALVHALRQSGTQ
jgi:hypothetical protein